MKTFLVEYVFTETLRLKRTIEAVDELRARSEVFLSDGVAFDEGGKYYQFNLQDCFYVSLEEVVPTDEWGEPIEK